MREFLLVALGCFIGFMACVFIIVSTNNKQIELYANTNKPIHLTKENVFYSVSEPVTRKERK